jgi:hypothetical protein
MTGCLKSEHWVLEMEFRAFSDDTYYLYLLVRNCGAKSFGATSMTVSDGAGEKVWLNTDVAAGKSIV